MTYKPSRDLKVIKGLEELSDTLNSLIRGRLWLQVMMGLFLGVGVGILLGPTVGWVEPSKAKTISDWLALPGQIFLAVIQMIVVPLIFASIISGIASSESLERLKRVGLAALAFFVLTTTVSILIGISLAQSIQPGSYIDASLLNGSNGAPSPAADPLALNTFNGDHSLPERIIDLIPRNPLNSILNMEMLQVVVFAIILGIAMVAMRRSEALPLLQLLASLQQVCMTIVKGAMWLAPIAVFGLTAQLSAQVGLGTLAGMTVYMGTVILGLLLLLVMYLILVVLLTGMSPWRFLSAVRSVQLLAFSTSSSAAVMPLAMKVAEEDLKVKPSVAQFVIPLGATINMNGTALYQGVATLFLAQVFGINLDSGALTLLVVTAVAASIGSPATPGVGIVILSMILTSVGVPLAGVGLLLGVDRILDMCRTAVNVTGDLVATLFIDRRIDRQPVSGEAPPAPKDL